MLFCKAFKSGKRDRLSPFNSVKHVLEFRVNLHGIERLSAKVCYNTGSVTVSRAPHSELIQL